MVIKASRQLKILICLCLAAQPLAQVSLASSTQASRCSSMFSVFEPAVMGSLPDILLNRYQSLSVKDKRRFENRFVNRDKIRARTEVARLAALILNDPSELPLVIILKTKEEKSKTFSRVLQIRLDQEVSQTKLENLLLELGYKKDSARLSALTAFQDAHARELESLRRFAINTTSTAFLGIPVALNSIRYQRFHLKTPASADPLVRDQLLKEIQAQQDRINTMDSKFERNLKIELALELGRRILVYGIMAIIINETIKFFFPGWQTALIDYWSPLSEADRAKLENQALTNWREIYEAFTGESISEDTPEYIEIKGRIHKASVEALKLHIQNGSELPE